MLPRRVNSIDQTFRSVMRIPRRKIFLGLRGRSAKPKRLQPQSWFVSQPVARPSKAHHVQSHCAFSLSFGRPRLLPVVFGPSPNSSTPVHRPKRDAGASPCPSSAPSRGRISSLFCWRSAEPLAGHHPFGHKPAVFHRSSRTFVAVCHMRRHNPLSRRVRVFGASGGARAKRPSDYRSRGREQGGHAHILIDHQTSTEDML